MKISQYILKFIRGLRYKSYSRMAYYTNWLMTKFRKGSVIVGNRI